MTAMTIGNETRCGRAAHGAARRRTPCKPRDDDPRMRAGTGRALRARVVAYVLAAVVVGVMAYGERWVLAQAPTPSLESVIATCVPSLVEAGGATLACTTAIPVIPEGKSI
jgi:hypothetical protein